MNEIIDCPTCRGKLGVPADRGTLAVTCPRCGHRWEWSAGGSISKWLKRLVPFGTPEAGFPFGPFDTPGGGWALLLLLGTLSFAWPVAVCLMPGSLLTVGTWMVMPYSQAAAVATGGMLLLSGFVRYLRCRAVAAGSWQVWPLSRTLYTGAVVGAVAICLGGISFHPFTLIDGSVLDEHLFRTAVRTAEAEDSPAALRDYLANSTGEANRDEARRLIAACYDRAIEDLKGRAEGQGKGVNREFFDAVLAVLGAMKHEDQPEVTVGFKGRLDHLPVSPEQEGLERLVYEAHLRRTPELKAIADRRADGSAILPIGRTFGQEEVTGRERVILKRLSEAVKTAIKQEVLSFRKARPGEKPVIDVNYHIHTSGSLYLYVEGKRERPKGLIRGYNIKWAITVRPPGGGAGEFVWNLDSGGLDNLTYDPRPGDPQWAPYAVVLYSGFHDMAGRLIGNFGLKPEPAPTTFTYRTVASRAQPRGVGDLSDLLAGLERAELERLEEAQWKEDEVSKKEDAERAARQVDFPKIPRLESSLSPARKKRIRELREKLNLPE